MIPKASSFPTNNEELDTSWQTGIKPVKPELYRLLVESDKFETRKCTNHSHYNAYFIASKDPDYDLLYNEWSDLLPGACRSSMRISRYSVDDYVTSHHDMGPIGIKTNRRLTIVWQLNDPSEYEGGDLVFIDGRRLERKQGAYAIFSSWQVHEVQPVTKGIRYSYGWWIT